MNPSSKENVQRCRVFVILKGVLFDRKIDENFTNSIRHNKRGQSLQRFDLINGSLDNVNIVAKRIGNILEKAFFEKGIKAKNQIEVMLKYPSLELSIAACNAQAKLFISDSDTMDRSHSLFSLFCSGYRWSD